MALTSEYIARAFSQALSIVGAERQADRARGRPNAGIGVSAIARRLFDNNRNVPGANYSSYAAVARRAAESVILAERMQHAPEFVPNLKDVPTVPTLYPDTERYRYAVAVEYSGANGRAGHIRAEVISDVSLSAAQIEQRVRERIDFTTSPSRATKAAVRRLGAGATVDEVTILSATRTY